MMENNGFFLGLASEFTTRLLARKVPFSVEECFDGYKWTFPFCEGDVILHSFSYMNGHCVESYRFPWDDGDVSALEIREMAERIAHLYMES